MGSAITEFVSRFIGADKDMLMLENDSWKKGIERTPSMHKYLKDFFGVFDFDSFPHNQDRLIYSDYFKNEDSKEYDLIIAELPFGTKYAQSAELGIEVLENWEMKFRLCKTLKDEGILLAGTAPNFGTTDKSGRFIEIMRDKGFFLSALLETPRNILKPLTDLQPNIAIFTKRDNDGRLFISSFDDNEDAETIFNNFTNRKEGDHLSHGVLVKPGSFRGFYDYRAVRNIENLQAQCREFKQYLLTEISHEINTTDSAFTEGDGRYLYISRIKNCNVFTHPEDMENKHQNYYQVRLREDAALPEYLEKYFASELGVMSLKSLLSNTSLSRITRSDIEELVVPLPPIEVQKEIIFSYSLMDKVRSVINTLEKDLSINPQNAKVIIEKLTDTLTTLNQLSKSDKVRSHIRQGENLNTEFKQTFSVDTKTGKKEKYIQDASLKNIAGFMNKEGGVLLIGVTDDGEIYGIENDHYTSDDKYLLNFKDKVKTAIGKEFYDLIHYEIVEMNISKVLFVECKASPKPVYLYGNDFYVRTNPATDKLEGPKLVEYITSHF